MTKEIKKLDYEDRLEIVEMMLKIIYSDQHLCNYEDRLIRKVSGLIYIESKDLGEIRLKVKNDLHSKWKCIKCKLTDCVEVCPVDCFYEGENMLVINPDECIDCGV